MKTKLAIAVLALVATAGLASAQNQTRNQTKKQETTAIQRGPSFVDKNNNGICDNFESGKPGNPNANGRQALCNGTGKGQGRGQQNGAGLYNGKGRGTNFIDANKNGICDRREVK